MSLPPFTRHIFVALIMMAALSFGVRFNEMLSRWDAGPNYADAQDVVTLEPAAGAPAEDAAPPPTQALTEPSAAAAAAEAQEAPAETASTEKPEIETPKVEWKDATDNDIDFSPVQMELFEDLSQRRKDIEKREQELATQEALLKAAERNLEQKYKELNDLRADVEALLKKQSEEEQNRIASLVKIYEGMKAKDAARIFDTLDMDVLLQVLGQMSERKSAPIIAAMNPERARSVTIMLAEQKALPTLDENFAVQ